MSAPRVISLRGVEVHNLRKIDLDLPHRQLIVFCGVSGSGKSSLAFDTLYAEGQRRYIETFSAYTRQFLERLEKPAAERVDGLPPAIAVGRQSPSRSSRATIGTATETADYLRLLYAKIGRVFCRSCDQPVERETPQSAASLLESLPAGMRFMISFVVETDSTATPAQQTETLREEGFGRVIFAGRALTLEELTKVDSPRTANPGSADIAHAEPLYVVVDRLAAGSTSRERLVDSLEICFAKGDGAAHVWIDSQSGTPGDTSALPATEEVDLDGHPWLRLTLSTRLRCERCGIDYPDPEPRLFSFNSPLGACPECEGFGNVMDIDLDLVVPDRQKTLAEGAVAPWNTPAYAHELEELKELAADCQLPLDVPFDQLTPEQIALVVEGVPERNFGGLRGFFAWLERHKYKMHLRVFMSRWRSYRPCPACGGARLRPEALATRVGGLNIAELCKLKVRDGLAFLGNLQLTPFERALARTPLEQVQARLTYLDSVGLGYLALDRTLRTLSGGELQRVSLTSALGSSLVGALYVLDEPSVGLHAGDTARLLGTVQRLRQRGNTVVVVEHEEAFLRAADQLVEIGPGAGERGGQVVFQGTPVEMLACPKSITGDYLAGRRSTRAPAQRRAARSGVIRLTGARGNNLQNVTVEFPLGMLCVVTGVSGAGKSTLVEDTLYPALCRRKRKEAPKPLDYDDVFGDGQLDDVTMVDQSSIGRSARSNPVTYVKAFDEIREVFADTLDAKVRNYTASYFSFNAEAGQCPGCQGAGQIEIDMQFMADVYMKCGQCQGTRYRREILDVRYRGRNIAEVLDMTVREAFTFFRGHTKVQARLKRLMSVGLDYVRLGQPANTLSGGESQRLKLAAYLAAARRGRTLFVLDEPTTGLHFADVVQLLDCFEALLEVGHSLIVVEHNMQILKAADYLIDLGPGAADEGGRVVATGTPEAVANVAGSVTGRYLAEALARDAEELSA
ncbi:MAG: excinuclease ABC subunit UvrA [Pirellulales bacterium]|nr:excinuclease ABC subunit UvrA [Pirellulales bacterium]